MSKVLSGQNSAASADEKAVRQQAAEKAYGNFLDTLGYDWKNDPNMEGTPRRVAKMYLNEVTQGTYDAPPKITAFPNQQQYGGMVSQGDIDVKSLCSHHMMPFIGKAYVAYIPGDTVIGLSKINRIVEFYSRRPQLQEQLTQQIHDELCKVMSNNLGVIVYIEAEHTCVSLRGVNQNSKMRTAVVSGAFENNEDNARGEFYSMINRSK